MNSNRERFGKVSKRRAAVTASAALALLIVGGEAPELVAQDSTALMEQEKQVATTQSKFYCNTKALNPAERARHQQLGERLQDAPAPPD